MVDLAGCRTPKKQNEVAIRNYSVLQTTHQFEGTMCQDLQAMGTHKANGCKTPKTHLILKGLKELTGSEKSENPNTQLHESSKFVKLLTDRSSSTNCRLLQIVETGFSTNVVEGNIESADPPLGTGFTGLRGRGGGPLDPAAGTTGVELLLLMRPASKDDPLRPVWDPSSAAGRVMIGGDIPVLLSLETTTAAAAAALDSSLSAHAPR